MNNWYVGQKVVCVDASFNNDECRGWWPGEEVNEGQVYTIARILMDGETLIVHLAEVSRSKEAIDEWDFPDLGYGAHRFRPVRATDISIFTAMLAPVPKVTEPV